MRPRVRDNRGNRVPNMPLDAVDAVRSVELTHVSPEGAARRADGVAVEEPLEVRLQGESFVVTMRTPGRDEDLVAGFLLSEGLITSADDLLHIRPCADAAEPGNVIAVQLTGACADRVAARLASRRAVVTTSACGVCGRRSIDDVARVARRVGEGPRVSASLLASLPVRLRAAQPTFEATGGLHAAGLFEVAAATLRDVAEDVGRHNAVDKVIGRALRAGLCPLTEAILVVSGRTSFEIVQKAVLAGIPIVVAVSAPSSLAIDLAREAGITLAGFVRDGHANLYTGEGRVTCP